LKSGCYQLSNMKVASFENKLYLGSTSRTTIERSDTIIQKTKRVCHQVSLTIAMPPDDVRDWIVRKCCPKCRATLSSSKNDKLLTCLRCDLNILAKKVKLSNTCTAFFATRNLSIIIYPDKLTQFMQMKEIEGIEEKTILSLNF